MAVRIVCLDGHTLNPGDNPWTAVEQLGELTVYDRTSPGLIVPRATGADILLTNKTPLSADTLAQLPDLKFVSVLATGYNIIDVAAARARGVIVANVPAYSTAAVAQLVFAFMLHFCHRISHHDAWVKSGEWSRHPDFCFWDGALTELAGQTLAVIGFGRIGQATAALGHAFGMNVIAHAPRAKEPPAWSPFAFVSRREAFEQADFLSLHAPLTDDTANLVNRETLAWMKPTAVLINTGRGPLVDEAALAEALNEGRLAGAAVDVVTVEPIREDNPLLTARNCVITPHFAWATLAARQRLMAATASNVAAFLAGRPVNQVS